jgi:hypothetical protein
MSEARQRDGIKAALNVNDSEYTLIYCEIEARMYTQGILGHPLRSISCRGRITLVAAELATKFPTVFSRISDDDRIRYTTQIAKRCNHNFNRVNKRRLKYNTRAGSVLVQRQGTLPGENVISLAEDMQGADTPPQTTTRETNYPHSTPRRPLDQGVGQVDSDENQPEECIQAPLTIGR